MRITRTLAAIAALAFGACAQRSAAPPGAPMATTDPIAALPVTGPRPGSGEATLGRASTEAAMRTPTPSAMAGDLAALGLDPAALPPLAKLPPAKLRGVMRTFTRALGAVCADCHAENDFRAPTPRKRIATLMWDRFVTGLETKDGALLYCDSCHAGKLAPLLDRRDLHALDAQMEAAYVRPLRVRAPGEPAPPTCATCHGEPFVGRFVAASVSSTNAPPRR